MIAILLEAIYFVMNAAFVMNLVIVTLNVVKEILMDAIFVAYVNSVVVAIVVLCVIYVIG